MAPKSTSKPASKAESMAPPSTASRKSARIAGSAAPESAAEPKKRPAPESKTGTEKKAKPASDKAPTSKSAPKVASKKAPASKANDKTASKKKEDAIEEEKAEEEKEAEAPADAEPTTDSKGPLKKGDKLPKITIEDNEGNAVDVSTLGNEGEKGIVLFLYPKADTPGCTTQACAYRDSNDEIAELGYTVYGLSKDKPAAQQKWITKKELNFKLLCDPESKLIKKLGAFVQPNNTKRSHFIFEKGTGKLVDIALGAPTKDDSANVIKFIKKHHE